MIEKKRNSTRRDFMKAGALIAGAVVCPADATTSKRSEISSGPDFDVKSFGASGDGKTIDTPAINRAIEAAAAAGGGTVVFPAGSYMCFSIRLKSKVTLRSEEHTSELQSQFHLVCRLLLEKKKKKK